MYIINVSLFFLINIASEVSSSHIVFFKRTPQTIVNDEFKMCFGAGADDCFDLSRPLYEYYIRSNSALVNNDQRPTPQEDHTGLRDTVDSIMFDFLNGEELESLTCIPYVSTYTDCTRENICTGCQTCTCDSEANWECKTTMRCEPEPKLAIDSKVLQNVLEAINKEDEIVNGRTKRELNLLPHLINYDYILKWLYNNDSRPKRASYAKDEDSKYEVSLNELLNSLTNEVTYSRRKALEYDVKYNIGSNSTPLVNNKGNKTDILWDTTELDPTGEASNMIIDLLETTNTEGGLHIQDPKLVKRDTPVTTISELGVTDSIKKLKDDILYPLTFVIENKQKEIDELLKIRKKMIRFLIAHGNLDTKKLNRKEETTESPYVSIYKIEVLPATSDIDTEYRRANISAIVDQFFIKLKKDIYEVIKDIVGIQKYSKTKTLPEDLKVLIRAMRYYVRHQDDLLFSGKKIGQQSKAPKVSKLSFRKNGIDKTYMKENINKIIKAVQDTPIPNAINNLSPDTYNIVKRIIKDNYNEKYGDHFNLKIDIKDVGIHWNEIMKDVEGAEALDKLSFMKLLYVILITDMNKVNHALRVLEFAKNRRLTIDGNMVPSLAKRINVALTLITGRLKEITKLKEKTSHQQGHNPPRLVKIHGLSDHNPIKKESMLQHIKDMLKKSKHEIVNLIRSKVSKSEIIKTIAKKKFGILSKEQRIQDVMEKWQKNLNITSFRNKRSVMKKIQTPKLKSRKINSTKNGTAKKNKTKNELKRKKVGAKKNLTKKQVLIVKIMNNNKKINHDKNKNIKYKKKITGVKNKKTKKYVKRTNHKSKSPMKKNNTITVPQAKKNKTFETIVEGTATKSAVLEETNDSFEDYLQIPA